MKKSSFVEGTLIATIAIVLTKILGMLYVIPFYSMVGTLGSALYSYAYNIYVIFLDISSAGLPIAISKIIKEYNTLGMHEAKKRAYKISRDLITIISIIIFISLFIFAKSFATLILNGVTGGNTIEDITFVIRCISLAILVIPYLSVTKGYLQGHNIVGVSSVSQILEQIARITIILVGCYLCINIFNVSIKYAIGISLIGATVGGLVAIFYIKKKLHQNNNLIENANYEKKDQVTNKEIIKKIAMYAVPFIIIDIAVSIYNFVDLILIMRTLGHLGFSGIDTEFISTSIATYSCKISMIVSSIAMGMSVSLIPSIVEAYTLKHWKDVNHKLNNALQIILVASVPMVLGLSLLAKPVWSIFYGNNEVGASILALQIFVTLFFNLYTVTSSTLQSMNKFKYVYISSLTGFILNAILDVPMMYLFNYLGLPPYFGAIVATMLGYLSSIILALKILSKEHKIDYKNTLNTMKNMIIPTVSMVLVVIILKMIIPINLDSRMSSILYVGIISIIGAFTYLLLCLKNKTLYEAFGENRIKNIIKKLTRGRISL